MKKRGWRWVLAIFGGWGTFMLACRASKGFARWALNGLSLPVMGLLNRLTAPVPFPLAELGALLVIALLLFELGAGLLCAARARSLRPLRRALAGLLITALLPTGALLALWEPARRCGDGDNPSLPDAGQLEWLCGALIETLNASELRFSTPEELLRRAPKAAGMPGRAVKAARYPEWMRIARLSGLFVPLTGEALVDGGAPAPLIPFTAVHELMHLAGIADEGAANIAAWERCLAAGGEFADSARLWALRYALGLLGRADPVARSRAYAKMEGALARVFQMCGEASLSRRVSPGLQLPSLSRGDYAALVGYLAKQMP